MATASNVHPVPAWRLWLWAVVGGLMLVPLAAMQFTREVAWTIGDFLAAAVLLGGAATAFEWSMRAIRSARGRLLAGVAIGTALIAVWLQLAVGIV